MTDYIVLADAKTWITANILDVANWSIATDAQKHPPSSPSKVDVVMCSGWLPKKHIGIDLVGAAKAFLAYPGWLSKCGSQ